MNPFTEKLNLLPKTPGVYKFFDERKNILYIGKGKNLFNRVTSYFKQDLKDRPRIISMIDKIYDLDVIETENEIEALVLEAALVKKYKPKFNTLLKDDKSYAYLFINTKDKYPLVKIVRNISKSEIKKGVLFGPYPSGRAIKRVFKYLRKIFPFCLNGDPKIPCFDSQIGLCPGPDVTDMEYRSNINGIINFLKGKKLNIVKKLEDEMFYLSNTQHFEQAAVLRDKIEDLRYLSSKIQIGYADTEIDYIENRKSRNLLETEKLGQELNIISARRIECYDISNISGTNAYGSMSVAINGEISATNYRIFKINTLNTPNDYEMLKEIVSRRIIHIGTQLDESLTVRPDIILIDGGIGQLNYLKMLVPKGIFLLGITKGRKYKRRGNRLLDEFWVSDGKNGLKLKLKHQNILVTLRNEAHRFAIFHHRKARLKSQTTSELDLIDGVGKITRTKLIKHFKNTEIIKQATLETLTSVIENKRIAQKVFSHFHSTTE